MSTTLEISLDFFWKFRRIHELQICSQFHDWLLSVDEGQSRLFFLLGCINVDDFELSFDVHYVCWPFYVSKLQRQLSYQNHE